MAVLILRKYIPNCPRQNRKNDLMRLLNGRVVESTEQYEQL